MTRPTSDRVKESLFNILANHLDLTNSTILDICSGSGALGIEALSRGARCGTFIDHDAASRIVLEKNLQSTGLKERSEIIIRDALQALSGLARRGTVFNLVFFDPPYVSELYRTVPEALLSSALLAPGAILVVEKSSRAAVGEIAGQLQRFDRRVYGETAVELYVLEEP
jgi:16S rRNA (guanine(966)-N(2))-methyltransferase RsmD